MESYGIASAARRGFVSRYLERLGFTTAPASDAGGLRALHRAHLRAIPFENLDISLGVPIAIGDPAVRKILAGRGGFCYELNGAFAALLDALGFTVHLLEARVYGTDGLGIRYDHMCLLVESGGVRYLADVGFGAFVDEPLLLAAGIDQTDRNGTFRLEQRGDGRFDVRENGVRRYLFDLTPRALDEFAPGLAFHQSTESHFAKGTVCSIATDRGRLTLSGLKLTETVDGVRTESAVDPASVPGLLEGRFGVRLDPDSLHRLVPDRTGATG